MSHKASQIQYKTASESRTVSVDFTDKLESGESLTGAVTLTATGITAASGAVNTAALTINGDTVAIGKAVQFTVSGGTAGTKYEIDISVSTDAAPAQTLNCTVGVGVH